MINYANFTTLTVINFLGDMGSLTTMSLQISERAKFFSKIKNWMERHFTKKQEKYLVVNLHNDSTLHDSLKYSTRIFPRVNTDGSIDRPQPIFFFEESNDDFE